MSEEPEPRRYSDRELMLSAISITFQRARTVQRELTGAPSWHPSEPAAEEAGAGLGRDADLDDGASGSGAGAEGLKLDESEEPQFPNPLVTDANFRHYLDQATANQRTRRGPPGLRWLRGWRADQARYNGAVVHALHQLDHRTRLQQATITQLEAELAAARRALGALESNELRSP